MTRFAATPEDDYPVVYIADTDKPLPRKVNPATRYAYFKLIARGGRSIIQSCKDLHLMRVVCYKSLKAEFADDPDEQRRFLREARVSAMLQHPNTVPTYELGRDLQGHYYFTMKMIHGYTLREIYDYRERYDLTRLVEVIIQVAHALEYAHGHGGRAPRRETRERSRRSVRRGAPAGLGSRQGVGSRRRFGDGPGNRRGGGRRPLADASRPASGGRCRTCRPSRSGWTTTSTTGPTYTVLGAVLYEALAGQPPVIGESIDDILDHTLHADIPPPSAVSKVFVPQRLDELCMRCLRRGADERVQTTEELIRELQEDW